MSSLWPLVVRVFESSAHCCKALRLPFHVVATRCICHFMLLQSFTFAVSRCCKALHLPFENGCNFINFGCLLTSVSQNVDVFGTFCGCDYDLVDII